MTKLARQAILLLAVAAVVASAAAQETGESLRLTTVVIDPGHGGHDPGAVAGDVRDKDLVLGIGLRLGRKISDAFPEVKVVYTRSRDQFIPLHSRASVALRNKADLFISLHANCVAQTSVRGAETFTLGLHRSQENLEVAKKENAVILLEEDYSTNYEGFNPNETESYIMFENLQAEYQNQSIDLAARVQQELTGRMKLTNRGVKQAGFLVLRQTSMPAVLVEVGFISNPAERTLLVSENGKEQMAEALFRAFSGYKQAIDERSNFSLAMTGKEKPTEVTAGSTGQQPYYPRTEATAETLSRQPNAPQSADTPGPATPATNGAAKETAATENTWYSVQVSASTAYIDPVPSRFKGEPGIIHMKVAPYHKYFIGRYATGRQALAARQRLKPRFPDAFPVVVEKGLPRPLKMEDLK